MSNKEHKKHPYLLKDLKIIKKSGVATDITYIPMAKGFMYLTAIIDLHTRFVLNWSSNTMSADWCADILQETIQKYGVPEILIQIKEVNTPVRFNVLLNNGIKISMDGKGRAIDNIFIERLWRTVKYENVYLQAYTDGTAFTEDLKIILNFIIHGDFISH
jgi:putative transposase